ncbi:(2Fe-2S)-binding protein [Mesorhizobium sp. WSM4307]|uniref:(2Fe-2S)-binding protein n=1 Tax=unclassified Mesorhizobium TaxID=325217 RepID=UPI00115CA684|nr:MULTISPECIES: (2Fe-2S)-binding protein [unclassified Mesorhizobium]TRC71289.1 (2Fe-2S)-binding protein [Mesorhizobium sp. WSM4315]TRC86531.1 (2Fe-2S)-binding protein [Mesorhizobium sp. WSM4307]
MIIAGRIVRLAEFDRAQVHFYLDGQMCSALAGDTVLTAMLASGHVLRKSEFGPEWRAGFCLMGACQDCWVWQDEGPRLRACSALIVEGLRLRTTPPESWP